MKWFYKNENGSIKKYSKLKDFPNNTHGFIYRVVNQQSGKFYIGKKVLFHNVKKLLTKKEIAEWDKPGRVPRKRLITSESDWQTYWGSNKILKGEIATLGEDNYTREILQLCYNKKQLTYYELWWQIQLNVLAIETYNENILGRFFRRDL